MSIHKGVIAGEGSDHPERGDMKMTRRHAFATAGVVAVLASGLLTATSAYASQHMEVKNAKISQATVANAFNTAIAGLELHLNNFGSKKGSGQGTNWLNDTSQIKLPGGATHSFSIPSPIASIMPKYGNRGGRIYKLYVNDVNTKSVQATPSSGRIAVAVSFESDGPELRVKCIRRKVVNGNWVECSGANIDMDDLVIAPALQPVVRKGSISFGDFGSEDVKLEYDLGISGHWICNIHNLCNWIAGKVKDEVSKKLKNEVVKRLNTAQLKDRVADTVRDSQLIDLIRWQNGIADPEWELVDISPEGSDFVLRFERPAIIQEASFGASPVPGACPHPATQGKQANLGVAVATYGQQIVRMRYRYPGKNWSSWNQAQSVPAWGGHMAHFDVTPVHKLAPGTHKIEVQVDRYEPILSQTVNITCPLEVSKIDLVAFQEGTFNPHSGGPMPMPAKVEAECPVEIGLRPIFTHSGTGSLQYRFRFAPDHKLTTPFQANFQQDGNDPLYTDPGFYHVFPLPLAPSDAPAPQGIGGLQAQQPTQQGLGLTTGQASPANEYKGSVRVEATTQFGTVASKWVPYHIVCKPKPAFEPVGGIPIPLPEPPPAPPSGLTGQQPTTPAPLPVIVTPAPVSPPRAQITCENGTVRGEECVCEASHRKVETGRNAWRCERPQAETRPTTVVPAIRPAESSVRPNVPVPPSGIRLVPRLRGN
jgi:hypothetical protein